jgi:NAD(P)-dependent dehydrogenase (short-subunit alcohol dehydrogenase family)
MTRGHCDGGPGAQSLGALRADTAAWTGEIQLNPCGGAVSLANQKILIIGGSSGIGLATARTAAAAGAAVTIASRSQERLNAALAELPDGCAAEAVDSNDEAGIASLFERVGELDHLVYTAGGPLDPKSQGSLVDISLDAARDVFEARFWGAVAAVKHAAPRIKPGGSVTLTSGATAVRPSGRTTLADASAGAVETLSKGFAIELAPVRVNAVRPGIILTPRLTGIPEPQRGPPFKAAAARTLVKKLGEPEEVAEAILFLIGNGFVTGSVITVDGGLLLV